MAVAGGFPLVPTSLDVYAPLPSETARCRIGVVAPMSRCGILLLCWMPALRVSEPAGAQRRAARLASSAVFTVSALVNQYCADCHDWEVRKGELVLLSLNLDDLTQHPETWEKVVRKLRTRQMPPVGKDRPDERTYDDAVSRLASSLDRVAAKNPNPGPTETFRRLNRTEYQNVIRGLLYDRA